MEKFSQASTLLKLDSDTRSDRREWRWTDTNTARAKDVSAVCNELSEYWPLTERQLYYRLISGKMINQPHWHKYGKTENPRVDVYSTIQPLLKWMRIDERLPWHAISDETRVLTGKRGYDSVEEFIQSEMRWMLNGYSRCVAQDQEYHIEIWIEKQALLNIVEPVADEYCRRVLCCKGYNSVTFQAAYYNRTMEALNQGLKPVVLYFGDWDPSGVNMIYAAIQTLTDEFGLFNVEFHRCGINPEHFEMLEADPVPLKDSDSRSKQFIEQHGSTCYELDAFHPVQLQKLLRESIELFTDMNAISCNLEIQTRDRKLISELRSDVQEYVNGRIGM